MLKSSRHRVLRSAAFLTLGLATLLPLAAADPVIEPKTPEALFVAGKGYGTYRCPALLVTAKGTVLAFCEGRTKPKGLYGDIDIVLRRSLDGGKTWKPLQVVADDSTNTLGNCCPVQDRNTGTIWFPFTRSYGPDNETQIADGTSKETTRLWLTRSDDDGATWAKPIDISATTRKPTWTWYGTGLGMGLHLKTGRLLVPVYHAEAGTKLYKTHSLFSDDAGKTWKIGEDLGPNTSESQIIENDDGTIAINARSVYNRFRTVGTSRDGGATWESVKLDRNLPCADSQGCLYRVPGTELWLFSNTAGPKRENLTVRLSRDRGQTWPHVRRLQEGPSANSALVQLPDKSIGCLYEKNASFSKLELMFARFSTSWVEAGSKQP